MLKKGVMLSLVFSCVFPLIVMLFLSPSIDRIMVSESTEESVRVGGYILHALRLPDEQPRQQVVRDAFRKEAGIAKEQFSLYKIRLFADNGEIVFSTDRSEEGTRNEKPYFRDIVSRGKSYSAYKETNTASLDGALLTTNVIETYLPIMKEGRFQGALEIYYDITGTRQDFQRLKFIFAVLLFGVSFIMILFAISAADKARVSRGKQLAAQQALLQEQARSESQMQQQLDRLRALRTIDRSISSSLDLKLTLEIFIDEVLSQLRVDAASVMLYAPETELLQSASSKGFRTDRIRNAVVRAGTSYAGSVILKHKSVIIPDLMNQKDEALLEDRYRFSESFLVRDEGFRAYAGIPLVAKGHVNGILEIFHRSPIMPDTEWVDFLEALAGQAAIAIDNATLFEKLKQSRDDLMAAYDTTIEGWARALDHRDRETEGHSRRVTEITLALARCMGVPESELVHIRRGALLHDIGKIGVPDDVLFKPGSLDNEQWDTMRRHPEIAHAILSPIQFLRRAMDIPYCHHERWDGSGYPRGLRGDDIPLPARIFAVVDIWDALLSDRPYRQAWPPEKAVSHIRSLSGTHLDPRVVDMFLQMDLSGYDGHKL